MADFDISALDRHLRAQFERLQALEQAGNNAMLRKELSRSRAIIEVSRHIIWHAHLTGKARCAVMPVISGK